MRKYAVVVTDDEKGNMIRLDRENQGFTGIEILGILDILSNDVRRQMTDKAFAEKVIEHKRVVVDEEENNDERRET